MDPAKKVEDFFGSYKAQSYNARQLITKSNTDLPGVIYLTDGRVNQYDIAPTGNEIVVNIFKPGAFFPMSWAINHTPNRYFFEASTKVTARIAPAQDVVDFLQANPDVMFDLLSRLYRGVDGVLRRMTHLMGGSAYTRLLFELINSGLRFGEQQQDGSLAIRTTENELAKQSGLARETVSRTLQRLKAEGLVHSNGSVLVIKSIESLEAHLGSSV